MKTLKKSMSLLIALVMVISCFGFSTSAYAADGASCTTITFSGYENNALAGAAANSINSKRAAAGVNAMALDYSLTVYAKQRAKDMMIYADVDVLPSGDHASAMIPGYASSCWGLVSYFSYVPSADSIASYYSTYYNSAMFNSFGVGLYTVGNVTVVYVLLSVYSSGTYYQDFADAAVPASVYTSIGNLGGTYIDGKMNKKTAYDLSVVLYPSNGLAYEIPLSNNQFTFKSSQSSVMKVKGSKAYPKKNGKFTLTAVNKNNSAYTAKLSSSVTGLKKPKVSLTSVTSKSKKITAKWKYSIKDASGYEVQYSTSKKFTKKTTKSIYVKGKKTTKKTTPKLKKGKRYYVRVRAYVDQGNKEKMYGGWSKTKSIKVK